MNTYAVNVDIRMRRRIQADSKEEALDEAWRLADEFLDESMCTLGRGGTRRLGERGAHAMTKSPWVWTCPGCQAQVSESQADVFAHARACEAFGTYRKGATGPACATCGEDIPGPTGTTVRHAGQVYCWPCWQKPTEDNPPTA